MGTRLRHIKTQSALELEQVIESLPYMVEIKTVTNYKNSWFCWFTMREFTDVPKSNKNRENSKNKKIGE